MGPGPARGVSYLFLGDIGDNLSGRDHVTVYRVPEPRRTIATDRALTGADTISLRYPDHPVDAESMFVDPRSGDLFIIDKQYTSGVGRVFRAPKRSLVDGADVTMEEVATVHPRRPTSRSSRPASPSSPARSSPAPTSRPTAAPCSCARTAASSRSPGGGEHRSRRRSTGPRATRRRSTNAREKPWGSPRTARATSRSARVRELRCTGSQSALRSPGEPRRRGVRQAGDLARVRPSTTNS